MKVVFRADASHQIGTGHVMRCLTLADALTETGATCQFICRQHNGHLAEYIHSKGYVCHVLEPNSEEANSSLACTPSPALHHADWLGVSWQVDARQTARLLADITPDWLVVDHYALAHEWESALQSYYQRLVVIDDLADRNHYNANILLDQTLGRQASDYRHLVNPATKLLLGAQYALLRPEFAKWREYSLMRREKPKLKTILVNLGGVDSDNVTSDILDALQQNQLLKDCDIVVVMGHTAPYLKAVQRQAQLSELNIKVLSGVSNMAELMANADLALGAAGSSAWERCCLGVPAAMVVLAKNQQLIANELSRLGACEVLSLEALQNELSKFLETLTGTTLQIMSASARAVCVGEGASVLAQEMISV